MRSLKTEGLVVHVHARGRRSNTEECSRAKDEWSFSSASVLCYRTTVSTAARRIEVAGARRGREEAAGRCYASTGQSRAVAAGGLTSHSRHCRAGSKGFVPQVSDEMSSLTSDSSDSSS